MHRKSTSRRRSHTKVVVKSSQENLNTAATTTTPTRLFVSPPQPPPAAAEKQEVFRVQKAYDLTVYSSIDWHTFFNGWTFPFFFVGAHHHDNNNNSSRPSSNYNSRPRQQGYGTINYNVNNHNSSDMVDNTHQAQHQDDESDDCQSRSQSESNKPIIPLELEASSERQNKLSKSIRLYALGLCAFAAISVGALICIGPGSEPQAVPSSKRVRQEQVPSSYALPRVKQPKDLKDVHEDEGMIRKLREEFHEWTKHHGRDYGNDTEKEKRFHIWKENHFRTAEKNEKHGPCKMTGKAVFGSNHFKDLTPQEFQSKYLTGYTGPHTDKLPKDRRRLRSDQVKAKAEDILKSNATPRRRAEPVDVLSSNGLHDPSVLSKKIKRHESVQGRYLKYIEDAPMLGKTYYNKEEKQNERLCKCGSSSSSNSNNYNNNNYNSNNYNNNNYNNNNYNNYSNRRFLGFKNTPIFGKTYYNKSEKQYVCGYSKTYYNGSSKVDCSKYKLEAGKDYSTSDHLKYSQDSCKWYDASCLLKHIFQPIYTSSSEKHYSNYNYPSSMDWRSMGAVTSVHSQGSCGACWAITAVETIESAYYIKTGTLMDLSESEIIICDTSCEMCNGGWPQNAYDYVIENKGIPKEPTYDGDLLMTMTTVREGSSDELTESEMENIYDSTCPDKNDGSTRYAAIDAYAYATDRCICYTDGTGCDCDGQNEALAVMNVASYGPATVCLEASTWQDYTGGIITADSGCSNAFLDMNHCVQTVGYAFQEVDGGTNDENNSNDSKDESGKTLEGYWIIRNQWSSYWGMNGYAYVAMGSNTCGVLNDMTQVFF